MDTLLAEVRRHHPDLNLMPGEAFSWSPNTNTITYKITESRLADSLLHEVAHAVLEHKRYETDLELVLLEVAAWDKAKELAKQYGVTLDEDRIQDCIDTYRDWLYQRSCCPKCNCTSLQHNAITYKCFNCGTSWTVTASRFCRPYRLLSSSNNKKSSEPVTTQTTFV
jgi:hypothetical protein